MYIVNQQGKVFQFSLSTPYDLSSITFDTGTGEDLSTNDHMGDVEFNNDGTKLYYLDGRKNDATLTEFSLSTPYDIRTKTQITSQTLSINVSANDPAMGFQFNSNGTAMFILLNDNSGNDDTIFQFRLSVAFDTSTATLVGSRLVLLDGGDQTTNTSGILFSNDGSKFYITEDASDTIFQFSLPCPFGFVSCQAFTDSNISSHVESVKKNIHFNNSTMFKRFEWIKRNRDNENLNSFNINLKSYNPILASLTNKLQASLDNNSSKIKSSTWSFWSTGDVSMGRQDATITDRPKEIHTSGLTFGADKKFGGDKFAGFALRYAQNDSSVTFTDQSSDMESLTLNFYGTIPKNETNYTNMIFGYSLLRIDQKYQGKKTGNRNGHQLFTSVNFRSKNKSGRFNFSPSGKFSYGITKLSDYTDFISLATTAVNDQHDNKTIKDGNLAIGFLFDVDSYKIPEGIVIPNGGFEFVMDVSPETRFTYDNGQSSTLVDVYSTKNLKGNLGFEFIFTNDSTLSLNYERFQHLDLDRSGKTETFIVKIGRIIEGDSEFALNYEPMQNNQIGVSYGKNMSGYNLKLNSNYSMISQIPEYETNIEVSTSF